MADEKMWTVPLRKELLKVSRYRRAKRAVSAVRDFAERQVKSEVLIGQELNLKLHEHGRQNPPPKGKGKAYKFKEKGVVYFVEGTVMKEEVKKKKSEEKVKVESKVPAAEEKSEKLDEEKKKVESHELKKEGKGRKVKGDEVRVEKVGVKKGEVYPMDEKPANVKKK